MLYCISICTGFPPQQVDFSLNEATMISAGDNISVSCYAKRQTTLFPTTLLEITWLDNNNNPMTSADGFTFTGQQSSMNHNITSRLIVSSIKTSQAGVYTCVVNMTISGVVEDHQVREPVNIYVISKQVS